MRQEGPVFADLQDRAVAWNRQRFPTARPLQVYTKLVEEVGEFGRAINLGYVPRGDAAKESADVLVSLMILTGGRWPGVVFEIDVLAETDRMLTKLETPGDHVRGSIGGDVVKPAGRLPITSEMVRESLGVPTTDPPPEATTVVADESLLQFVLQVARGRHRNSQLAAERYLKSIGVDVYPDEIPEGTRIARS